MSEVRQSDEEAGETPLRVLLVEDNEVNRKVIECILNLVNAQMVAAENGLEGVQAYQSQDFDVVLMDLQMPVMDGFTATREIRAFEKAQGRPRTPVIVVSANVRAEDLEASRRAGADRHLAKPVDVSQLFEAISETLAAVDEAELAGEARTA